MVTFQTAEGRGGSHIAESLDDALRFIERLRNNEEAQGVRLFRMHEVPIEFRAYFKVEVGAASAADAESASMPEAEPEVRAMEPEVGHQDDETVLAPMNGENAENASEEESPRRLFQRS